MAGFTSLSFDNTYITPAVDALHFSHQGHPWMPVVAVVVIVLAKFAVSRPIRLHHVGVFQVAGCLLLLRTFFTAVRRISSHGMTACHRWTRHLLAVYLAC